jgi:anti-sigma factor RsiW
MKCEDVSRELIAYLDRRANSGDRAVVEEHLKDCAACRTRAEDFRKLWNLLDEVPVQEPSFGFDARIRQRISSARGPRWFAWLLPEPRLVFTMALLVALSIWMWRLPQENLAPTAQSEEEQFQVIKDLGVLENYDVLSKSEALSELPPMAAPQPVPEEKEQQREDGGK